MVDLYRDWIDRYPIVSIEDGLDENDWDGWKLLTDAIGDRCQLVGDDLFVTNVQRLDEGIMRGCGNAILIKVNQSGTLTETLEAIEMARTKAFGVDSAQRSGETDDDCIAGPAVAPNARQHK